MGSLKSRLERIAVRANPEPPLFICWDNTRNEEGVLTYSGAADGRRRTEEEIQVEFPGAPLVLLDWGPTGGAAPDEDSV